MAVFSSLALPPSQDGGLKRVFEFSLMAFWIVSGRFSLNADLLESHHRLESDSFRFGFQCFMTIFLRLILNVTSAAQPLFGYSEKF